MYVMYRKTDQVKEIPVTQARAVLAELVNEVAYGRERITFTRHGKPLAVLVSVAEAELLDSLAIQEATTVHALQVLDLTASQHQFEQAAHHTSSLDRPS